MGKQINLLKTSLVVLKVLPFMLFMLFIQTNSLAQVPQSIGGFTLGEGLNTCKHLVQKETDIKIRHLESLHEQEIKPIKGFKSGLIAYGTCDKPNTIVRIKLKYLNSDKKFYNQLLERFKKHFGEPDEWRGDPFHVVIAWKWHFKDEHDNRISIILQHNTGDKDEKLGNSVKLSLTNQIEREKACIDRKNIQKRQQQPPDIPFIPKNKSDWDLLLPH